MKANRVYSRVFRLVSLPEETAKVMCVAEFKTWVKSAGRVLKQEPLVEVQLGLFQTGYSVVVSGEVLTDRGD